MGSYRPIYSTIWKDPDFERYDPNAKLLFIYLCTNASVTESGIYRLTVRSMSNETSIDQDTLTVILQSGLLKNIMYDFETYTVCVRRIRRYSTGGNPEKVAISILRDYNSTRDAESLWQNFFKDYPEYRPDDYVDCLPIKEPFPNGSKKGTLSTIRSSSISSSKDKRECEGEKVQQVFDCWNEQQIVVHRTVTEKMKVEIKKALKDSEVDEILGAIRTYAEVLKHPKSKWNYKWPSLDLFLKRGLTQFMDATVAKGNWIESNRGNHGTIPERNEYTQSPRYADLQRTK